MRRHWQLQPSLNRDDDDGYHLLAMHDVNERYLCMCHLNCHHWGIRRLTSILFKAKEALHALETAVCTWLGNKHKYKRLQSRFREHLDVLIGM